MKVFSTVISRSNENITCIRVVESSQCVRAVARMLMGEWVSFQIRPGNNF